MTLTELRYITAVAKSGHFGQAADACFVSQPTLSIAIKKLEEELNTAIFERSNTHVTLTALGEKIIQQAQLVLDEANKIKLLASGGDNQLQGVLKIGAIYTIGPYLFPYIIPKLKDISEKMPLEIHEDYTYNLATRLRNGNLDVAILSLPFDVPGIETCTLYEEPFQVLLPKTHHLAKQDCISHQDLSQETVLLLGEGHCFRDQVLTACPECEHWPATNTTKLNTTQVSGSSLETIRHMVVANMGITIIPSLASQKQHYAQTLCTKLFHKPSPKRQVVLAWRKSFHRPDAIELLKTVITRTVLKDLKMLHIEK